MRVCGMMLVGLAAAGLGLAGCGKEQAPATGGGTIGAPVARVTEVTGPDLDAVTKSTKPYRLALVVKTRNNPFFDPMIKAAQQECKALAGTALDVQAPQQEGDKEQQFNMVQNIVARGVDALLVAPADSKAIVPALKAAQDKGILVINIDNRVDRPTAQAAGLNLGGYVGADNESGGKLAGQAMVEALQGKARKVAIIEGIRGADNAEARKRGFEAAARGKLDVVATEAADWDTQKAYEKAQNILAAHPDLNGIFCANDMMAIGAMRAVQDRGAKGKVTVVGFDNLPEMRKYLQDGALYGTIEQHPDLMGRYGVKMAVGVLSGTIKKGGEYLVPLEVSKK